MSSTHHALACPECKRRIGVCACGHADDGKMIVFSSTPCYVCRSPKLTPEDRKLREIKLEAIRGATHAFKKSITEAGVKSEWLSRFVENVDTYIDEAESDLARNIDFEKTQSVVPK